MARLNVYLPDELAARAKAAELNVSALTQRAVETALTQRAGLDWLARVAALPALHIEHDKVVAAVAAARDELAGEDV